MLHAVVTEIQAQKQLIQQINLMTAVLPKNKRSSSSPSPRKTKSKKGLFNLIVKMLHCRDQADDLTGCIINMMFEIINSQQEAMHHNYEMYSVIPQTLLHAGKSPFFRGVEVKLASHVDDLRVRLRGRLGLSRRDLKKMHQIRSQKTNL